MSMRFTTVVVLSATVAMLPATIRAQKGDLTHEHAATPNGAVDFGVFPTGPLGPLPCLQSGAIGGPADPCQYKLHHLTPEEVTILKGGEVTFQIHGGGHGLAIYEVSKDTTRDEIGQFLCPGDDPATFAGPEVHPCVPAPIPSGPNPAPGVANAAAHRLIRYGHNDVVIVAAPNVTNAHPDNRVWSPEGRLMSAGGRQFLNGGTIAAGPTSDGQLITYKFLKNGRYLV